MKKKPNKMTIDRSVDKVNDKTFATLTYIVFDENENSIAWGAISKPYNDSIFFASEIIWLTDFYHAKVVDAKNIKLEN